MSKFFTAYDTIACDGYGPGLNKTIMALKAALYDGSVKYVPGTKILSLVGGSALANNVPAFAHPIIMRVTEADHSSEYGVYIDSRSYGRIDPASGEFSVKNDIEYKLHVARAELNYIWVNENGDWLRDVSPIPMAIYASWMSEAIGRRFALDPREQFNIAILAGIFYCSQFSDKEELDEKEKLYLVNSVTRAIKASAKDVLEIVDKVSVIRNLREFCARAEEVSGSIRLKELNPGLVYAILGNTWYGLNAAHNIAVAIEHPPTWIAILLSSFTERSFSKSQIAKITERSTFKRDGEQFVRSIRNLISTSGCIVRD